MKEQELKEEDMPDLASLSIKDAMWKREAAALDSDSPVAACNCLTMSPALEYHKRGCKYRLILERDEARKLLADESRAAKVLFDKLDARDREIDRLRVALHAVFARANSVDVSYIENLHKIAQLTKRALDHERN